MSKIIKIGTRRSALAMAQTALVVDAIKKAYPEITCEIVQIVTKGDKILDRPLLSFGGKGVFVSEFEQALQEGRIDLAIHSAKDMPMDLADGLSIVGTLSRADVRDVLIKRKDLGHEVKVVGTSSLRRKTQVEQLYPVICKDIRGNVGTRLDKLNSGEYDAIILAAAGLERLGIQGEEYTFEYFNPEQFIPAGGQAIIAIEGRKGDPISELIQKISDQDAKESLETERKVLHLLNAGCHEAVGVYSVKKEDTMTVFLYYKGHKTYQVEGPVEERLHLAETIVKMIEE